MDTIKVNLQNGLNHEVLNLAGEVLRKGGTIAFPTETVYGLGADALNPSAVKKIFEAKGRPQDNPLIIHVADWDLSLYAEEIPEKALMMMKEFWPGPLTLILKKKEIIPNETSAGLDSVGIRMPSNEVARGLIRALGRPIAAPSANISGRPSPTNFERCVEDLDGKVDMIIGDGNSIVGLESTIVDYSVYPPRLLRPGYVTYEELLQVDADVVYEEARTKVEEAEAPKAPGMKYRHYAPKAPMTIVRGHAEKVKEEILHQIDELINNGKTVGVFAPIERKSVYNRKNIFFVSMGTEKDLSEIARNLFEGLRRFDDVDVDVILSEGFQETGVSSAIMNRLKKAASFNIIEV
jgi:L-threonylcarbamoyladenylate synthase